MHCSDYIHEYFHIAIAFKRRTLQMISQNWFSNVTQTIALVIQLFVQLLLQANNKVNIKALRYCPSVREYSRPRLNIKTVFPRFGWVSEWLNLTAFLGTEGIEVHTVLPGMGIFILRHLYIETAPWSSVFPLTNTHYYRNHFHTMMSSCIEFSWAWHIMPYHLIFPLPSLPALSPIASHSNDGWWKEYWWHSIVCRKWSSIHGGRWQNGRVRMEYQWPHCLQRPQPLRIHLHDAYSHGRNIDHSGLFHQASWYKFNQTAIEIQWWFK